GRVLICGCIFILSYTARKNSHKEHKTFMVVRSEITDRDKGREGVHIWWLPTIRRDGFFDPIFTPLKTPYMTTFVPPWRDIPVGA
ncbi:MAG: hypothetical protein QME51_03400, partial [Planctomycetota bacterium]|nr:hypothetical protein [Planctomycetota bacterium]